MNGLSVKTLMTIAAAATLAMPALAAQHEQMSDEQMTMLEQRLQTALNNCDIDIEEDGMMQLTMAQVSGIVLTDNSGASSNKCQEIEAIARGDG